MGLFCANFHFRTTDDKALTASLKRRGVTQYRVAPARNGWTTLYEERASQQDEERIRDLAGGLSKDLHVPAIAFMVHDSDIACYWLFDDGRPLDEFNSCPDYFDDVDESSGPTGGDPAILLKYCRPGVQRDELVEMLTGDNVFAEGVVEQLAEALGIDPERALSDFRDLEDGDGPDDDAGFGGNDDRGGGSGRELLSFREGMADKLATLLGTKSAGAAVNPQVAALVRAASEGNVAEIDRLLLEGAAIDGEAPAPLPGNNAMGGLGKVMGGALPQVAMTPLLAAIFNKNRPAAERLLLKGANPNRVSALFGTAVHAAVGAGEADLLALVIEHGGDVQARNAHNQTPLELIAAGRASRERIEQAQATIAAMGVKLPDHLAQLQKIALPLEGWDACERLLKTRTGG